MEMCGLLWVLENKTQNSENPQRRAGREPQPPKKNLLKGENARFVEKNASGGGGGFPDHYCGFHPYCGINTRLYLIFD